MTTTGYMSLAGVSAHASHFLFFFGHISHRNSNAAHNKPTPHTQARLVCASALGCTQLLEIIRVSSNETPATHPTPVSEELTQTARFSGKCFYLLKLRISAGWLPACTATGFRATPVVHHILIEVIRLEVLSEGKLEQITRFNEQVSLSGVFQTLLLVLRAFQLVLQRSWLADRSTKGQVSSAQSQGKHHRRYVGLMMANE